MRAEIVTIGDELCRGEIVDTSSAWLAARLWELDVTVTWMTSCRDVAADVRRAVTTAAGRADVVLVSGGLGPTEDDVTVDAIAAIVGGRAEIDPSARARMVARLSAAAGRSASLLRQLRVPAGARVLGNPVGLAPGFEVVVGGTPVCCMPGVPAEMRAIFDAAVEARVVALREAGGGRVERMAREVYRVFGRGESRIAEALAGVLDGVEGASLHYQVAFPETLVKVVVRASQVSTARAGLATIDARVRDRLGADLVGAGEDTLASVLGARLRAAGATLATAESCTGGLVGALATAAPGASAWYAGGVVTYAEEHKVRQLDVPAAVLADEGVVSRACAIAMARGARARFGADYAAATTGVAGPSGGSARAPVGLVWIAAVGPGGALSVRDVRWSGDRASVRQLAAHATLALVLRMVEA